jgi:hypothetical protein
VYDPQSEFALGGDEDGWTATHRDPAADAAGSGGGGDGPGNGATGGRRGGDDGIPSLDDDDDEPAAAAAAAGGSGAGGDDDDIPDIEELDIEDDDEVGLGGLGEGGCRGVRVGLGGVSRLLRRETG